MERNRATCSRGSGFYIRVRVGTLASSPRSGREYLRGAEGSWTGRCRRACASHGTGKSAPEAIEEEYDNGERMWWRYCARTEPVNSGGFIPRATLLPLIGYRPNWNLHGFGDNHSGVKRLRAEEFMRLRTVYEESAEQADLEHLANNTEPPLFGGIGGEEPDHRALKERIAADPVGVLGEEGLTLYDVEFAFRCTGDRIDVVLRDRDKRFVAVEVEVQCSENELAGPLQCMKYRSMLAYLFRRPVAEVRCNLAAHEIARAVSLRCEDFEIQTVVVSRAFAQESGG